MRYCLKHVTCNIFIYIILLISFFETVSCESVRKLNSRRFQGRYTRDITEYQIVIPTKINKDGNFNSYSIPHFYQRLEVHQSRKRRETNVEKDALHYNLYFNGKNHHIELLPNLDFMAPGLIIETQHGKSLRDINLQGSRNEQCHYTGKVRGEEGSRVALSVGDGLVGYIKTTVGHFFIEPALNAAPNDAGQHVHVMYQNKEKETAFHSNVHTQMNGSTCGNNEEWGKGWQNSLEQLHISNYGSPKKRSSSKQRRYIKSLVAADKRFMEHHRDVDIETYILTIMNMVSDYFHDDSVGNLVDFVVVRIVLLEKDAHNMDIQATKCANKTLHAFCKWQQSVNPVDVQHPNHHDIAILLTRQELHPERDKKNSSHSHCQLLGSSNMASACVPQKACTINVDTGLLLGVVVTHQVGHLLGCGHDTSSSNDCQPQDKSYYVMAPVPQYRTSGWSNSSRKSMSEFFDSELGACLLTAPADRNFNFPQMLPGAMYDATQQCQIEFGAGAVPCQTAGDTFCATLRCRTPYSATACFSRGGAMADGTACGTDKWCFAGRCVETGERPGAVNGGWGNWTPWGPCSRSCGGGVAVQERSCDNPVPRNKGRYCIGEARHYQTCNITPCNSTCVPYREAQCKAFDAQKVRHSWRVYVPKAVYDRCALLCVNECGRFKVLSARVKDGTPCRAGTRDMCVGGTCLRVGCDWQLGSDAIEDQCGICRGDGTQCNIVTGTFSQGDAGECSADNQTATTTTTTTTTTCRPAETVKQGCTPKHHERAGREWDNDESTLHGDMHGGKKERRSNSEYKKVKTIPKGARNLKIVMLKPSPNNSIALAGENGTKFYINGEMSSRPDDGGFDLGRVSGFYNHPEPDRAEMLVAGPLPEDLSLFAVVRNPSCFPDLRYSYAVPSANASYLPKYHWEFLSWDECDVQCGGGSQQSEARCVEAISGRVTSSFCHATEKPPPLSRVCGRRSCEVGWRAGAWTTRGRRQTRRVRCVREAARVGGEETELSDRECQRRKPATWRFSKRKQPKECGQRQRGRRYVRRHGSRDLSQVPRLADRRRAVHKSVPRSLVQHYAHLKHNLNKVRSEIAADKQERNKNRVEDDDDDDEEGLQQKAPSNNWSRIWSTSRTEHEKHYHDKRLKSYWCDHKLIDKSKLRSLTHVQNLQLKRMNLRSSRRPAEVNSPPGDVPMIAVLVLNDKSKNLNEVTVGSNQYIIRKDDVLRRLEQRPGTAQVMLVPGTPIQKKSPLHKDEVPGTANKYSNATSTTQHGKNKTMENKHKSDRKKPADNKLNKTSSAPKIAPNPLHRNKHPPGKHKSANCTNRKGFKKSDKNKGVLIEDYMPQSEVILMESQVVPSRTANGQSPGQQMKICDDTNMAMGDRIGRVVLDLKREKTYRGKEAIRKLKLIANRSKIYREEKENSDCRTKKMKDRCAKGG